MHKKDVKFRRDSSRKAAMMRGHDDSARVTEVFHFVLYTGCARSGEENLGSDTEFSNRVGGVLRREKPTVPRRIHCSGTSSPSLASI